MRVLYAEAVYGDEEIEAVNRVLRERPHQLMMGPAVREFEAKVAALFAKGTGVMVNSGSSANLLSVAGLDLAPGSEVVTPALTFSTTVAPLVQLGLVPAFVDVEAASFCIDVAAAAEVIGPRTKAILAPNLIGNLPDWAGLRRLADEHGLVLIEDSADTIGATFGDGPASRFSDVSTTSFYGSHVITAAGQGGMVATDDQELVERVTLMRGWGRRGSLTGGGERAPDRFDQVIDGVDYDAMFVFESLGYNMVPSEISAAFGLVQLDRLPQYVEARRRNFGLLFDFFAQWPEWFRLPVQLPQVATAWLAYAMVVRDDAPFTRRQLQGHLEEAGIQTRPIFTGNVLRQPGFADIPRRQHPAGFPNADGAMRGGIMLGCHQGMTDAHLNHIRSAFEAFAARHS